MISNALPQTPISGGIVGILSVVVEGQPVVAAWGVLDGCQQMNIQGQDGGKEGRWVTGSGNEIVIQDKGERSSSTNTPGGAEVSSRGQFKCMTAAVQDPRDGVK